MCMKLNVFCLAAAQQPPHEHTNLKHEAMANGKDKQGDCDDMSEAGGTATREQERRGAKS